MKSEAIGFDRQGSPGALSLWKTRIDLCNKPIINQYIKPNIWITILILKNKKNLDLIDEWTEIAKKFVDEFKYQFTVTMMCPRWGLAGIFHEF